MRVVGRREGEGVRCPSYRSAIIGKAFLGRAPEIYYPLVIPAFPGSIGLNTQFVHILMPFFLGR